MTALLRTTSWVLVFVAIGASGASWFTPRPDLDAGEAARVATGALDAAGYEASVPEEPVRTTHETDDGTAVPVWDVFARIAGDTGSGDTVELRVSVDAGRLVFVDDRVGADRNERLLSDDEYSSLAAYRENPTLGGWVGRNLAASVGGLALAGVSYVVARRSEPLWRSAPWT